VLANKLEIVYNGEVYTGVNLFTTDGTSGCPPGWMMGSVDNCGKYENIPDN